MGNCFTNKKLSNEDITIIVNDIYKITEFSLNNIEQKYHFYFFIENKIKYLIEELKDKNDNLSDVNRVIILQCIYKISNILGGVSHIEFTKDMCNDILFQLNIIKEHLLPEAVEINAIEKN